MEHSTLFLSPGLWKTRKGRTPKDVLQESEEGSKKLRGFILSIWVISVWLCVSFKVKGTITYILFFSTDLRKQSKRSLMKVVVLLFSSANLGKKITQLSCSQWVSTLLALCPLYPSESNCSFCCCFLSRNGGRGGMEEEKSVIVFWFLNTTEEHSRGESRGFLKR